MSEHTHNDWFLGTAVKTAEENAVPDNTPAGATPPAEPAAPAEPAPPAEPELSPFRHGELLENIKGTASKALWPSLAAILGMGGAAALTTSQEKKRPGETPEERRNRIIRNALMASGLTTAAIGGGITGYHLLGHDSGGKNTVDTMLTKLLGKAIEHGGTPSVLGGGGAAIGGIAGRHLDTKSRMNEIKSVLPDKLKDIKRPGQLQYTDLSTMVGDAGNEALAKLKANNTHADYVKKLHKATGIPLDRRRYAASLKEMQEAYRVKFQQAEVAKLRDAGLSLPGGFKKDPTNYDPKSWGKWKKWRNYKGMSFSPSKKTLIGSILGAMLGIPLGTGIQSTQLPKSFAGD
jgi:hypothetical protein